MRAIFALHASGFARTAEWDQIAQRAAEDFSYICDLIRSFYARSGGSTPSQEPHHSCKAAVIGRAVPKRGWALQQSTHSAHPTGAATITSELA